MRIIRKFIIGILGLAAVCVIVILLFFRQESYQLYKVMTFFEPDQISNNFRGVKHIFPTRTVPKASTPFRFINKVNRFVLPETFDHEDSVVNTKAYLDFTLTDALLIIHNDSLVYEYYANDFTEEDHHISWSMSKSVISALFGIALHEGKINSIEETVTDYLPQFTGTGYDGVKIKDVLQMSTGVGFNEDYGDFYSDINVMGRYFALGMPMEDFSKRLKREREPGNINHYVSINTQVLGMILVKATGKSITDYMAEKLWSKIGTESEAYWIVDKAGMEFALGGLNATARDYAKIGQLYLDSGRWQGEQIIPEEWVIASITPDAPHLLPGVRENGLKKDGYGFQWWLPYGREDEFNAQGIYGQFIYVDPDKRMVIVKLSSNYHFKNDKTGFFKNHEIALYREIARKLDTSAKSEFKIELINEKL